MKKLGKIIIISGPSGVGKHSIITKLMENKELNLEYSISMTTRNPREGEIDGKDYYFASQVDFEKHIQNNEFIEYATFCNNSYGTLKKEIERIINLGKNVILEIEVQGAIQVIQKLINEPLISIFVAPPNIEELTKRLTLRNTENSCQIEKRVKQAHYELTLKDKYKYIVVNDDLETAINNITNIIKENIDE